jgi:hypothetical protein
MNEEDKLVINTERLQSYVASQVLAEEKYQRENDAKLRAVNQRVPTYEDFRQMVLASHLKPLDKGETLRGPVGREKNGKSWNSVMIGNKGDDSSKNGINANQDIETSDLVNVIPKSNLEFVKNWRFIEAKYSQDEGECNQMKWLFMWNLKAEKISQLFRPEINGEMLGKFLVLFECILKENETEKLEFLVELLKVFTKCNRFNLNMMFLKASETEAAKNIFQLLEEHEIKEPLLKKCYIK